MSGRSPPARRRRLRSGTTWSSSTPCFSPDGTRIATASWDGTARIWDAKTGERLIAPLAHDGIVRTVVFSADGKWLLTGSVDGTVRLWDAARGKLDHSAASPQRARLVCSIRAQEEAVRHRQ